MRTNIVKSRKTRALLAVVGAAALVGAGSAAYASPPWQVEAGGLTSPSPSSFHAVTTGTSPQIHFNVPALGMTCTDGTADGTITLGSSVTGLVGGITSTTFNGCLGPLGIAMNVTQNAPWSIWATGPTNGSDETPGEIRDVDATVSNPDGLCSFDVTGTVGGNFDNVNHDLDITGPSTLVVSNVVGCFGLIASNDPATFTADYVVSNTTTPGAEFTIRG